MRTRKWLSHTLVLLSVTTTAAVIAATPAEAVGANFDTAGINKAAGSVTTHAGKVITGITFISEKDLPTARNARAAAPSSAVEDTVTCLDQWRYINAGGTNPYWKPQGAYQYIYANGNRAADYWNQQFLPCYLSSWAAEPNSWAFLANVTGGFVSHRNGNQLNATAFTDAAWVAEYAKVYVCSLDGYWMYLYLDTSLIDGTKKYAYRDPTTLAIYHANGPISGNHLFHIDQPIGSSKVGLCAI